METNNNLPAEQNLLTDNCFWQLDLYTGALTWSAGICALLDLPIDNAPDFERLISLYLPETNLRQAFKRAIHQGIPFSLDLNILNKKASPLPVYTIGSPVYDDYGLCVAIKGDLTDLQNTDTMAQHLVFISENTADQRIMLQNFAKIISHNLRSHTSNLQMVVASMEQNLPPKDILELMGNIKTISQNLNQTVGYLNTLVKI